MKLIFAFFLLFLTVNFSIAQNDTGQPVPVGTAPPTEIPPEQNPHRAGKANNKGDLSDMIQLDAKVKVIISELSQKWKVCGGDNSGMTDLLTITSNLLITYESHKKVGMQPDCDECQKKASRYECMAKDNGFKELKLFIEGP